MKSLKSLKKQAIKASELTFKSGKLDENVAKKFINAFKKLPLNESITSLNYFLQAVKRETDKITLTVESVLKLPPAEIKVIENNFKKEFKVLETQTKLNSSLLGGIKVKIGDIIFDNSLKSRVTQIKEALVR